jgi:hypothetical protein
MLATTGTKLQTFSVGIKDAPDLVVRVLFSGPTNRQDGSTERICFRYLFVVLRTYCLPYPTAWSR